MIATPFWTGVVEDRDDPERLGRCQVRIFGYHTEDKVLLPTKDLPWAIPVQGITSAATSGIGITPVGIVTGTWVVGFFIDGEDCQQPVIMGTIAGKPKSNSETNKTLLQQTEKNTFKDSSGNQVFNEKGEPVKYNTNTENPKTLLAPLTAEDVDKLLGALSNKLSGKTYSLVGQNGELGAYQFSAETLINLGYLKRPTEGKLYISDLDNSDLWTGKDGAKSKEVFLKNVTLQDQVALKSLTENYNSLIRLGKISEVEDKAIVAGLLAASHVDGVTNSDKLDKQQTDGSKLKEYFVLGNSIFGGTDVDVDIVIKLLDSYISDKYVTNYFSEINNTELAKIQGFIDPNKQYPRPEYANKTDLNKLAVSDGDHIIFKLKENNRISNIPVAGGKPWNEPDTAYGGEYPYNQVIETEAGHVIELDSTPGAERIQVFHKTGSYIEIDVNGSMVRKVIGDNYEVIDRNNLVYVKGAQQLTVDGKTSILVRDDAVIDVEGNLTLTSHGDSIIQTAGTAGIVAETAIVSAKNGLDIISEGSINIQGSEINMRSSGATNIKAGSDLSLQSGQASSISLKGGLSIALDAAVIKTKMGANSIKNIILSLLNLPERKSPNKEQLPLLERRTYTESTFLADSLEPDSADYSKSRTLLGQANNKIEPAVKDDGKINAPTTKNVAQAAELAALGNFTTFPRSYKLSKYFTINDMLKHGNYLVAQKGLSEQEIVLNLKNLAVNCLDPIKEKYKDTFISSGFRIDGRVRDEKDHGKGCAVDLVFTKTSVQEYKDIAAWIYANVPFKQILLEYEFRNGAQNPVGWIHISLEISGSGNTSKSAMATGTLKNHVTAYSNQFVNLA